MADENRTQQVSLGCGTLILIGLIVLIFSGRVPENLDRDIKALRTDVQELKKSIDDQTNEIQSLQQKLNAQDKQ
jgi:Sec-independent protein translocase protein TatA